MAYVLEESEIPKNAIVCSPQDALVAQWETVEEWEPAKDVFFLRFGCVIKCVLGSFTGYYINNHYRRKCKLKNIGYMASYLPIVLLPGFFSLGYHRKAITSDILIQETKCPVCIEIKSMVSQALLCVVYPLMLSPITNYMLASRYNSCRIPMINIEPKKLWGFHKEISKPLYKKIPLWGLVNVVLAAGIAHFELKNFWTMTKKLDDFENKIKSGKIIVE